MKRIWLFQTIMIVMLLWGIQRGNPYAYYTVLKWVCCISCLYLATRTWNLSRRAWTAIFVIIAIIYNPVLRFYATWDTWVIIDIATAVVAAVSIFSLKTEQ